MIQIVFDIYFYLHPPRRECVKTVLTTAAAVHCIIIILSRALFPPHIIITFYLMYCRNAAGVCVCISAIDRDLIYDPVESTEMPCPIIRRGFAVRCKKFANTRTT